jgi:hypothetical protein
MRMLLIAALLCGCGGDERDEPSAGVAGNGGAAGSAGSAGKGGAAGASGTAGAEEGGAAGEATAGTGQAGMLVTAGTGGIPEPSGWLEPCGECDDPAFPVCAYVITEDDTPGAYRCTAACEGNADCTKAGAVCRSDCGGCEKHCAPKVDSITRWLAPCAAECDFGDAKECALISIGTEEAERCTFACDSPIYTDRCALVGGSCEEGGLCELFL